MAFRDDLEAQVHRAEAAEREVERLRGELAAEKARKARTSPVPPAPEADEDQTGWTVRRTLCAIAAGLGGVTALSLVVGFSQGEGSGQPGYDAVELVVYLVMSLSLAGVGVLGAARPGAARLPVLLWSGLAVLVEVSDMVAEARLFGAVSSWVMSGVMLAVPVVLAVAFRSPASGMRRPGRRETAP